jgi:AcrR family transcriptional regulator
MNIFSLTADLSLRARSWNRLHPAGFDTESFIYTTMARTLDQTKRTAILTAARTIFVKDGYASAKMSDIATEAGVAPGTLYLYYENKEALASAIGEDFFARLGTQFASIIQEIEDPEGIVSLVDWALQVADEERVVLAMAKEHRQSKRKEGRLRFVGQLADALSLLMSRGVIRNYSDATTLADVVLAVMRRVIMSYAIFEDENTDQLKATAVTVLQHALFDDVTLAAYRLVKRKQS